MRTPQVSFFTFYAQSCKIFMSQQWGPGRCPLKCSVDIFSSGVIAPEFHVNTALSAPPQKKRPSPFWREMVITTTGRWGACFHRGSGRVTFKRKKKRGLCLQCQYLQWLMLDEHWLTGVDGVCVGVCLSWRQRDGKARIISMNGRQMSRSDEQI